MYHRENDELHDVPSSLSYHYMKLILRTERPGNSTIQVPNIALSGIYNQVHNSYLTSTCAISPFLAFIQSVPANLNATRPHIQVTVHENGFEREPHRKFQEKKHNTFLRRKDWCYYRYSL